MKKPTTALFALVGVALIGALPLLGLRYFLRARTFFRPPRKPVTDADRRVARARLPDIEDVSFRTEDGLTLRGFFVPSHNGAVLVMGHGLGENRMRYLPVAEVLARHGYGSLFFDWRAHGESEGDVSTWSDHEQRDFAAAVGFALQRPDVTDGRVAGLGFSVGASTVAVGAAADPRVRAVILEAVFPSFADEMKNKMSKFGPVSLWPTQVAARQAGVDFDHIRPVDRVAAIAPRPVLFIAGSADYDTPLPFARRVFDAALQPKEMWVVEGAGHGQCWTKASTEYERVLVDFLDRAFFSQARSRPPVATHPSE